MNKIAKKQFNQFLTKAKNLVPYRARKNWYAAGQKTVEFIPFLAKPAVDRKTYETDNIALVKRIATITAIAFVAMIAIAASFETLLPLIALTFVPTAFLIAELWRASETAKELATKSFQSEKAPTVEVMKYICEHPKAAQQLVTDKVDLDKQDQRKTTLLHQVKNPKIAKILVKGEARVDVKDSTGLTALEKMVSEEKLDILEVFLKSAKGVDTDLHRKNIWKHVKTAKAVDLINEYAFKVNRSENALLLGSAEGKQEVIDKLLELGANPDQKDVFGRNALHRCKNASAVSTLVKGEVDLELEDINGKTPLHFHLDLIRQPKGRRHIQIATGLLQAGAQLPTQEIEGQAPLVSIIEIGYTGDLCALIDAILEKKPDLSEALTVAERKAQVNRNEYKPLVDKLKKLVENLNDEV